MPKRELSLDRDSQIALARCLRVLREMANPPLKQWQAAEALQVSRSTLCQVELGNQEPSLQLIRKAARLYKVHPNTILGVIYMQEFYFEEFDPDRYVLAAAAGAIQAREALTPQQRQNVQVALERLGYERS